MQPDFKSEYADALALVRVQHPEGATGLPSFDDLTNAISEAVEDEDCSFTSFEAFYQWWDVLIGYESLDTGEYPDDHKMLLEIAYRALVVDGVVCVDQSQVP